MPSAMVSGTISKPLSPCVTGGGASTLSDLEVDGHYQRPALIFLHVVIQLLHGEDYRRWCVISGSTASYNPSKRRTLALKSTFRLIVTLHYSPVLSACPLHTNSGRGKERRKLIGPW